MKNYQTETKEQMEDEKFACRLLLVCFIAAITLKFLAVFL